MFPLVKTGGLGDVTGGLPPALNAAGAKTTTMLPGYPAVLAALPDAVAVHRGHEFSPSWPIHRFQIGRAHV